MPAKNISKEDAICLYFTYYYADLLIFKKQGTTKEKVEKILKDQNVKTDEESITAEYNEIVRGVAKEILPPNWGETNHYWGGKCFTPDPGWNAPKNKTLMTGENDRFLCSTCKQAIVEELQRFEEPEFSE